MVQRCTNPRSPGYKNWGGRGITICTRWRASFAAFLADMGPRPSPKHAIDRKDNNGPYSPENCRWVTRPVQNRNRRVTVMYTWRGRTMTLAEWAQLLGVRYGTLQVRRHRGWSIDRILSEALGEGRSLTARDKPKPSSAKLTAEQVREIRRSTETDVMLGRRFGVTHQTISDIRRRKHWKHLP